MSNSTFKWRLFVNFQENSWVLIVPIRNSRCDTQRGGVADIPTRQIKRAIIEVTEISFSPCCEFQTCSFLLWKSKTNNSWQKWVWNENENPLAQWDKDNSSYLPNIVFICENNNNPRVRILSQSLNDLIELSHFGLSRDLHWLRDTHAPCKRESVAV